MGLSALRPRSRMRAGGRGAGQLRGRGWNCPLSGAECVAWRRHGLLRGGGVRGLQQRVPAAHAGW
eukprot:8337940-Pyramimonas_sp.AAC.1